MPPPADAPPPKRPPAGTPMKPGAPEPTSRGGLFIKIGFVIAAVLGIIWMIYANPREKAMICTNSPTSLIGFGGCTTE